MEEENDGPDSQNTTDKSISDNITTETDSIQIKERSEPCMICTDDMIEEDLYFLQCFHKFHTRCISRWLTVKQQCPICKFPANVDIVGVDEHGNFITSTGHTITNGIIENREAILQESMDTRISRAIDLLRELHSQSASISAQSRNNRMRNLRVNVESNNISSQTEESDADNIGTNVQSSDDHISDSDDIKTEDDSTNDQLRDIADWDSLLRHVDGPITRYSSRRTRESEYQVSLDDENYTTQEESEDVIRTFSPIDDNTENERKWVDNMMDTLLPHNTYLPTTPLLNNINDPATHFNQPRTPSPYPIFRTDRRNIQSTEVEYSSLYEHIISTDANNYYSSSSEEFTYDSDGDTHTDGNSTQ